MIGIQNFNSQNNSENKGKWSFNYTAGTNSTFNPIITKPGRPRWDIGDGSLPITSDGINVIPAIDGTKGCTVWVDKLENITEVSMANQTITGHIDFTGFNNCVRWIMNGSGNPGINQITFPTTDTVIESINWGSGSGNSSQVTTIDLSTFRNLSGNLDFQNHDLLTTLKLPERKFIELDGVSEYMDFGNDASLKFDYTDSFSFSFWINITSYGSGGAIISNLDSSSAFSGYEISWTSSGKLYFSLINNSSNNSTRKTTTSPLPLNTWKHAICKWDGSNMSIFLDGINQGLITVSNNLSSTIVNIKNLTIGRRPDSTFYGNMSFDKLIVYNKTLTPREITTIYEYGRNSGLIGIGNEVAQWEMDTLNPVDVVGSNNGTNANMEESDVLSGLANSSGAITTFDFQSCNNLTGEVDLSGLRFNPSNLYLNTTNITSVLFPYEANMLSRLNQCFVQSANISGELDFSVMGDMVGVDIRFNNNNVTSVKFPTTSVGITRLQAHANNLQGTFGISGLSNLSGYFDCSSNNITKIELPTNSNDFTRFDIGSNNIGGSIDLTLLSGGATQYYLNDNNLTEILFPTLDSKSVTYLNLRNNSITSLDLSPLENLSNDILCYSNPNLKSVTFPTNSNTIDRFEFYSCDLHGTMGMSSMSNVGGEIQLYSNSNLTKIELPTSSSTPLTTFDCYNTGISSLDLSNYDWGNTGVAASTLRTYSCPNLTEILFPSNITGKILQLIHYSCDLQGTAGLSNLGTNGIGYDSGNTASRIEFYNNPNLTKIELPPTNGEIHHFLAYSCNLTGTMDASMLTGFGSDVLNTTATFQVHNNVNLTELLLPVSANGDIEDIFAFNCDLGYVDFTVLTGNNDGVDIRLYDNNMAKSEINQILTDLDGNGWINGILDISGTNDPGDTTSGGTDGLLALNNLIDKGWTVTMPFDPLDISNVIYWIDPTDSGTVTTNSGNVSLIEDKSSNGYDFAQTSGSQPPYVTGSYINFDDTSRLDSQNVITLTNDKQLSFCFVIESNEDISGDNGIILELSEDFNNENDALVINFDRVNNQFKFAYRETNYTQKAVNVGSTSGDVFDWGEKVFITTVFDKNLSPTLDDILTIYVNAIEVGSIILSAADGSGTFGNHKHYLGSRFGEIAPSVAKLYELMAYNKALTLDEVETLYEFYIKTKHGI